MTDDLDALRRHRSRPRRRADLRAWDAVRVATLGKSGRLTALLKELGTLPPDERRDPRRRASTSSRDAPHRPIEARRAALDAAALDARLAAERIDVTLPPPPARTASSTRITRTMEEMAAIFGAMGFRVGEGLDVQTDWFNFSALNIPAHHPARADHDTFYLPGTRATAAPSCSAPRPATSRSSPC